MHAEAREANFPVPSPLRLAIQSKLHLDAERSVAMRLKNKVAIVTGAARGLGAAFAIGFGQEGAKVVIGDIRDGGKTVDAIKKAGSEALYVKMDVTKQDQCDALAKAAWIGSAQLTS